MTNKAEAVRHASNEIEMAIAHLSNAAQLLGLANIVLDDLSAAEVKARSARLSITLGEVS